MAESSEPTTQPVVPAGEGAGRRQRTPHVLTLLAGLVSLAGAAMVLIGWVPDLRSLDLRWVLAVAAVALGALLLVGTLRRE
ncbi:MAG: hypothetical protein M3Z25_19520 [Actinomycetota bacterium]|nr:hypothetical protein [Actinomycetota bacterium]